MKRTYLEILKCNEFNLLLAGFVQTGVLFVFPYLTFSPLRSLISSKYTDYTHGNAICDSSKLYSNTTFTFDINLSLIYTANAMTGADPGFFLGWGAPLRNDVTDR